MTGLPTNKELQQKMEKWMASKNVNYLQYLIILFILAPLGVWALFINYFGVNVPYWDEWEIVKLVKNFSENNLQIPDLFAQHNEHRIFFPNLIMIALSEISRLNTQWFIYFSFFLLSLILLLLYLIFRARFKDIPLSLIWFVPISWFVFNFAQTDLMFWGYELSISLCIFGFFAALYCLDKCEDLDKWLIFALLGGILSTFSFFNGLLVWPIGFIFICLTKKSKVKILIVWSLFALLSYGVFFYNWVYPSHHPSMFYMFQNPISSLEYFIVSVGCPLLRSNTIWTYILGCIVLSFYIMTIFYIIKNRLYRENALYLSLMLFSLGSSFMLTVGRSGFGVDQATASRYISFTLLGIIGVYFVILNLFFKSNLISKFISVSFAIIIILIFIGIINAFIIGVPDAETSHNSQLINQDILFNYKTIPLNNLNSLYPNPTIAYDLSIFLEGEKMSIFASRYTEPIRLSYIGVYQIKSDIPVGEIIGGTTVGQTFYSPYPNLNSIDVLLATYTRTNTKNVTFHLTQSSDSPNDIASVTINAHEIQDNSYYKFEFPKINDSLNKSYYFFIDSPDSTPGDAITIWSNKEDVYPQGSEYINSTPVEGDLSFKVYYFA
jgi:hypothetical protein